MSPNARIKYAACAVSIIGLMVVSCAPVAPAPTSTPQPTIEPTRTPIPTPTPVPTWNNLAQTPPMGWNSWNKFGCDINEQLIVEMTDAMVSSGMKEAGYEYVNLDDCWMALERDSDGNLQADPEKFPHGIQFLSDYVHAQGLKFGVYLDRGTETCAGYPGSYGYEAQDAQKLAEWGVDYLKYDNCESVGKIVDDFRNMHNAIEATGRPILFSMCTWGFPGSYFADLGLVHMWRTTPDIQDNWKRMIQIMDANHAHAAFAGPGRWNDPDMLEVGNGGMTHTEYRTHFSMWALMAAPLIAGNDLRDMDQQTLDILTAPEVIAINQDPLGKQGTKITFGSLQVWSKTLSGTHTRAVALLNRTEAAAEITVNWKQIKIAAGPATVRDLWERADLGTFTDSFTATVPPHGVVLIKVVSVPGQ